MAGSPNPATATSLVPELRARPLILSRSLPAGPCGAGGGGETQGTSCFSKQTVSGAYQGESGTRGSSRQNGKISHPLEWRKDQRKINEMVMSVEISRAGGQDRAGVEAAIFFLICLFCLLGSGGLPFLDRKPGWPGQGAAFHTEGTARRGLEERAGGAPGRAPRVPEGPDT